MKYLDVPANPGRKIHYGSAGKREFLPRVNIAPDGINTYRRREVGCSVEENLQKIARYLNFEISHPHTYFAIEDGIHYGHVKTAQAAEKWMCQIRGYPYMHIIPTKGDVVLNRDMISEIFSRKTGMTSEKCAVCAHYKRKDGHLCCEFGTLPGYNKCNMNFKEARNDPATTCF